MGCNAIMAMYYGYSVPPSNPIIIPVQNKKTGKTRFYRAAINVDLCEFQPTDLAVEITEEIYNKLTQNFEDTNLWKSYFPPNSWSLKGLGVLNLMDVTIDQAMMEIVFNLLYKDPETFNKIAENLKVFLGYDDIEIGFTGFEGGCFVNKNKNKGFKSIMLQKRENEACSLYLNDYHYHNLVQDKKHLSLYDIDNIEATSLFIKELKQTKFKSYLIQPIIFEDEILGFIELGSDKPFELNEFVANKLEGIIPALATATARFKSEYSNRIEALLQEKCTSIHDSVKWKFTAEANRYITELDAGGSPVFSDITLDNIYPLYGQLDIKDSSLKRNTAITLDLISQLRMVHELLSKAYNDTRLPTIEELKNQTTEFIDEIANGIIVSSEHSIASFFKNEINPMLDLLMDMNIPSKNEIQDYLSCLDSHEGLLYQERKNWDETVQLCNQSLAKLMDKKQVDAQKIFPHYFERFNTDGLEYNIYIGDSTSQDNSFNHIYLENLRLWQLTTMCEMERSFKEIKDQFKTPIEVASLILLFNSSFNVKFREDEKRFDVVGAYNARYEIIKKRIDKAKIKGTSERITQPEHICIIYTSPEDKKEYLKHIHFLENKGLIVQGSLDDHELEDLQGVTGLKALRIKVKYD